MYVVLLDLLIDGKVEYRIVQNVEAVEFDGFDYLPFPFDFTVEENEIKFGSALINAEKINEAKVYVYDMKKQKPMLSIPLVICGIFYPVRIFLGQKRSGWKFGLKFKEKMS